MRFAPMIYGPTVLFTLGEGAVIPLFPVIAARLGADLAVAALVAAALVVGQLFGNVPAGWAVARIGERLTMTFAGLAGILGVVAMVFATSVGMLMASVFIIGFCASAFGLARHSFMTTRVPLAFRARALALLGGSWRLGMFVGPFVAAAILLATGNEQIVMWFFGGCLLACVALVFFGPDPEEQLQAEASAARRAMDATTPTEFELEAEDLMLEDTGEVSTGSIPTFERQGVFATMWANRRVLSRVGVAAATLSSVRAARTAMLPLWGLAIGLDAEHIALIVGISGAIDFALFYASGQIMDRFGRTWVAGSCVGALGLGVLLLPLTHTVAWVCIVAGFMGVGNGLASGIVVTLGADNAPHVGRQQFLGGWRLTSDIGYMVGPAGVSGLVATLPLASALAAAGGVVLMAAGWTVHWTRWSERRRLSSGG